MSIFKHNKNENVKTKLYYALGEIFLIVVGILLALFLNNVNAEHQYKKKIDKNILRVYEELGENIKSSQRQIENLHVKDSLIYLVMQDSLHPEDYQQNFGLAYLIIYYHSIGVEDQAYQNLIQLNTLDNDYQDDLMTRLVELYAIAKGAEESDQRIQSFVYDESIPLLGKHVESFGDLTYKGEIKKDAIEYFLTSDQYKAYVSQYAIIAIKNQLRNYINFYKYALSARRAIAEAYDLSEDIYKAPPKTLYPTFETQYANTSFKDTVEVSYENDSLFLNAQWEKHIHLIPINKRLFLLDNKGYFVSFIQSPDSSSSSYDLNMHILARQVQYDAISTSN